MNEKVSHQVDFALKALSQTLELLVLNDLRCDAGTRSTGSFL